MRFIQNVSLAFLLQAYLTLGFLPGDAYGNDLYLQDPTNFELYQREAAYFENHHPKRQLLFDYLKQAHLQRRGNTAEKAKAALGKVGIGKASTPPQQNRPNILPLTHSRGSSPLTSINVQNPQAHDRPATPPPAPPHPPAIPKPKPPAQATLPGGRPLNLAVKHEPYRGVITDSALRQAKNKLTPPKTNEQEIRAAAEGRRKAAAKGKGKDGKGKAKENASSWGSRLATMTTVGAAVTGLGVAGWGTGLSQQSVEIARYNQRLGFANAYHAGAVSYVQFLTPDLLV